MTHDPSPSARRTRTLPQRPSLEHLKNEAKQRLKSLRQQNPQAKLAAVQLALALEYGFASWRQLKAHVDRSDPAQLERKRVFDGPARAMSTRFAALSRPASTPARPMPTGAPFTRSPRPAGMKRSKFSPATCRRATPIRRRCGRRSAPSSTLPIKAALMSFADCSTLTPT